MMADQQPVQLAVKLFKPAASTGQETPNFCLIQVKVPERADLGEMRGEVMLVLDRSGSMYSAGGKSTRAPIDEVADATAALINALRPSDRLGIVAFDHNAELISPL